MCMYLSQDQTEKINLEAGEKDELTHVYTLECSYNRGNAANELQKQVARQQRQIEEAEAVPMRARKTSSAATLW